MILALDGNAWASLWEWSLGSGSVVVWVGVWHLHLMAELIPHVHYLPARPDLSDLEDVVEWALTHHHEVEAIIANAKALFKRLATPEHTMRYLAAALASV